MATGNANAGSMLTRMRRHDKAPMTRQAKLKRFLVIDSCQSMKLIMYVPVA
jgi:hypothetical protein